MPSSRPEPPDQALFKPLLLTCLTLLVASSWAQSQTAVPPFKQLVHLYDYNQQAPLDVQQGKVETVPGATIHRITYASPKTGRVTAFLMVPEGKGPFAAIVFQHWGLGDKAEFLPEATLLARAGAVSILIDAPWARPKPWRQSGEGHVAKPEIDRDLYIQTVVDLRRAVDVLLQRPDVDPRRIAYAGHSYGATWGGVLAGVEHRIKAFALMAGLPTNTDFTPNGATLLDAAINQVNSQFTRAQIQHYIDVVAPTDPVRYVGHAAPSALFMQFGEHDLYISKKFADEYYSAASEPKQEKWYNTGHELNSLSALRDRDEWFEKELSLRPVLPLMELELDQ
ncbi:MAG: alpha/beta hydrolase family protein [Terriglobia bacterium]